MKKRKKIKIQLFPSGPTAVARKFCPSHLIAKLRKNQMNTDGMGGRMLSPGPLALSRGWICF